MSGDNVRSVYRILDSSANRAGEGIRTVEEFARFILEDASATESCKRLRHDLAVTLSKFPRQDLLRSRDTPGDIGTEIRTRSEYRRESIAAVIAAATTRVQQALRTLEEYGKTIDPTSGPEFEQIRYRWYSLAADLELQSRHDDARRALQDAKLYALVDCARDAQSFTERIATLAAGGVDLFQLRDPSADDRSLLDRARLGTPIANQHGALLIVNDRPDIAIAAKADGVHVGQQELPVAETRNLVGSNLLIGVSTHNIEQARAAVSGGADYIGCGPTFPGQTKDFDSFPGTEFLNQISAEITLPAFAIGGIDLSNVNQVIEAGLCRIAVTGALRDATDAVAAASQLKEILTSADS